VLIGGAVVALGLARYCDLRRLPDSDFLPADEPHTPTDTGPVGQHGVVAGN